MRISSSIQRAVAFVALLVFATGVNGQDASHTKFGNFVLQVPNGWNPVEKEDAMLLVAPAPPPGTATYIALAESDLDGDLKKSFNEFLTVLQKSYRVLQGGQTMPMHSKKGYDAYFTTVLGTDQGGKQWNIYLVGIQYGKRLEMVTFWSNLPSSDTTYDAYLDTFMTFLDDVSFEDTPAASKIPADPPQPQQGATNQLPAGRLQGVYVATGSADGRPSNKQYIFYPDGLMVYGIPQEGMIGFDFDPARPALIKINETSAHPAWDAGWDTFIPMCRCTGKTFSGKYRWGAPAADQYLQFFADGTFIDHRVTDQLIVPSPFYSRPRIQRGTYTIQSQTIIFNFADGHRGMRTFVAPKAQENQPMFDWIGLGIQQLFEESYAAKLAR